MEDVSAVRKQSLGGRVRVDGGGVPVALGVRWGKGERHPRDRVLERSTTPPGVAMRSSRYPIY